MNVSIIFSSCDNTLFLRDGNHYIDQMSCSRRSTMCCPSLQHHFSPCGRMKIRSFRRAVEMLPIWSSTSSPWTWSSSYCTTCLHKTCRRYTVLCNAFAQPSVPCTAFGGKQGWWLFGRCRCLWTGFVSERCGEREADGSSNETERGGKEETSEQDSLCVSNTKSTCSNWSTLADRTRRELDAAAADLVAEDGRGRTFTASVACLEPRPAVSLRWPLSERPRLAWHRCSTSTSSMSRRERDIGAWRPHVRFTSAVTAPCADIGAARAMLSVSNSHASPASSGSTTIRATTSDVWRT